MLNNKLILMIFVFVLFWGTISALEVKKTEFVIKTEPYQNLSISVLDSKENIQVELFEGRARKFGEFRFTYYGAISKVDLLITIVDNETGKILKEKKFGPYSLGVPMITEDFYLLEQKISEDEPVEDKIDKLNSSTESELIDSQNEKKSLIQGLVIGENLKFSNRYYYIGAGVLGVLVLIFVLKKHLVFATRSGAPVEPHPNKIVKSKPIKPSKTEITVKNIPQKSNESTINETERRISDLQKQLEDIRNEEKLLKLQKQINQEKQSLREMQEDLVDKNQKLSSGQNNNIQETRDNQEPKSF